MLTVDIGILSRIKKKILAVKVDPKLRSDAKELRFHKDIIQVKDQEKECQLRLAHLEFTNNELSKKATKLAADDLPA